MGKAFERLKTGLEDAIEYAQGDTHGRRTHQVEAPAVDVRDIGQEILEGVRAIKAHKAGKQPLTVRTVSEPAAPREIRRKLKLSQHAFAGLLGVSVRTVQDWEQERRVPRGPAKALLRIADQHPEVFLTLR